MKKIFLFCMISVLCLLSACGKEDITVDIGTNDSGKTEGTSTDSSIPDFNQLQYGDICSLGSFVQSEESGQQEPLQWIVYEKDDHTIKLITKEAIDCMPFHAESQDITWEECSLRMWLNNSFYDDTFTEEEKQYISEVIVSADENSKYPELDAGNDTEDYVYLLSVKEAEQLSSDILACKATDYAISRGSFEAESSKNTWWWLRSPGDRQSNAAAVITDGSIDYEGNSAVAELDNGSVRPCITINY